MARNHRLGRNGRQGVVLVAVLNEGLYPSTTGTSHAFVFRRNGVTLSRSLARHENE